jgi:hypothetical protein
MNPGEAMTTEILSDEQGPLCYIVRAAALPNATCFPTPGELPLQAGFVVHRAGHCIAPHVHLPLPRSIVGTSEVLLVLSGCCELDVYDRSRTFVGTRLLEAGDLMVLVAGGHGFRMVADTVLFEVKQGPYFGPAEKEPI